MIRTTLSLMVLAVFVSGVAGQQHDFDISKFKPDKFILKGRLVSVAFARVPVDNTMVLQLQFLAEDRIADSQIEGHDWLSSIATSIQFEPALLNTDNYQEAIEAAIGNGVKLGGSCLVVSDWPGARGKELVSIEPWTPDAEARIRADNHNYIQMFRRRNNMSPFSLRLVRLRTLDDRVEQSIKRIQFQATARADEELIGVLKRHVDDFRLELDALDQKLSTRRNELAVTIDKASDNGERQTLGQMLNDLKGVESTLQQNRDTLTQRLREAGFESMVTESSP